MKLAVHTAAHEVPTVPEESEERAADTTTTTMVKMTAQPAVAVAKPKTFKKMGKESVETVKKKPLKRVVKEKKQKRGGKAIKQNQGNADIDPLQSFPSDHILVKSFEKVTFTLKRESQLNESQSASLIQLSAHQAFKRTYACWWPGMRKQILLHCNLCEVCTASKGMKKTLSPPLGTVPFRSEPLDTFCIDIHELGLTTRGNRAVLLAMEMFTKIVMGYEIATEKATTTV